MVDQRKHVTREDSDPRGRNTQPAERAESLGAVADAASWIAPGERASAAITPRQLLGLQRTIGNRSVSSMLARRAPGASLIHRHPEGAELPEKTAHVAEIEAKAQPEVSAESALPSETRTAEEATAQKGGATTAGAAFQGAPALTRGAMSLASAQKILQGQFGDVKTIVSGAIVILADQAACSAKFDEVCIAANLKYKGQPWKAGDRAKMDAELHVLVQGFEWKGIVYVNGTTSLVTATAHEILHANVAAGFRAAVGETFNEGITEFLARKALTTAGITVPAVTAYPNEVALTAKLLPLVGESVATGAYFAGHAALVAKYEELKGPGTWAPMKVNAEALDATKVTAAFDAPKPAPTPAPTPVMPATPVTPSTPAKVTSHGSLGRPETEGLLSGKGVGAWLLRFSTSQGKWVVSSVTADGYNHAFVVAQTTDQVVALGGAADKMLPLPATV